jgi:hypothetical protein
MGETIPAIHQKYIQSRQRAYEARQRALLARTKYKKALQKAEEACKEVQNIVAAAKNEKKRNNENSQNPEDETESTDAENKQSNENSENCGAAKQDWKSTLEEYRRAQGQDAVDHVTHLLSDVKVLQRRYESLVENENAAVKFAQKMEAIALEGLQKLEEQRLCLYYDSLVRTFQRIKSALDDMVVSINVDIEGEASPEKLAVKKKGDFFTNFLKAGVSQESTGAGGCRNLGYRQRNWRS